MDDPVTMQSVTGGLTFGNYWRSVFRFGLPCTATFDLIDYLMFRLSASDTGIRYHWGLTLLLNIPVMFIVSAVWLTAMHEIASRRRKNPGK